MCDKLKFLATLRQTLCDSLIERDAEVDALLLALLSDEHLLLVGPPGTAKSTLLSGLSAAVGGAKFFDRLMTKFTTPEELFGPLSLTALKNDQYVRQTTGYLPDADFAFLDEIWKSSSAILNTLLTVMQERAFDNGTSRVKCPLKMLVAASNEWPNGEGQQELGAAFDRFLIRATVKPVSPSGRDRLIFSTLPPVTQVCTLKDLEFAAGFASVMPVSVAAKDAFHNIVETLHSEGVVVGDRRLRKSVKVVKAAAVLAGASQVEPEHLDALRFVLWSDPVEHPAKAASIIAKIANPAAAAVAEVVAEIDDLMEKTNFKDTAETIGAVKKLKECQTRLTTLAGRQATDAQKYVVTRISEVNRKLLG